MAYVGNYNGLVTVLSSHFVDENILSMCSFYTKTYVGSMHVAPMFPETFQVNYEEILQAYPGTIDHAPHRLSLVLTPSGMTFTRPLSGGM